MSSTLSTPDPAAQVAEVRHIIEARGDRPCESTLLAIRRVVDPPPEPESGWPVPGFAWERHDDPEQQP